MFIKAVLAALFAAIILSGGILLAQMDNTFTPSVTINFR